MIKQGAFSTGILLRGGSVGFEFSMIICFVGGKRGIYRWQTSFVDQGVVIKYAKYVCYINESHCYATFVEHLSGVTVLDLVVNNIDLIYPLILFVHLFCLLTTIDKIDSSL